MTNRKLLPYEANWLKKYQFDFSKLPDFGETPVEYITGYASFFGITFKVDSSTLIPRIETEEIIPPAIAFLNSLSSQTNIQIADIGTGSGCLAVTIAHELLTSNHNFHVTASDISTQALSIARQNASSILGKSFSNISFINSSLLEKYPKDLHFDLVVSNLPYVPTDNISTLDPSVKDYEPHQALDGGPKGVTLINRLLDTIKPHLKERALLILEIDSSQTLKMFHIPPHSQAEIKKDMQGRRRFLFVLFS